MGNYFHEDFLWRGSVGCGTKAGLAAYRRNWQLPLRAAFADRVYTTERTLADGDWAACFGAIEATHVGLVMGIAPTGRRVRILRGLRGRVPAAWLGRVRRRGLKGL